MPIDTVVFDLDGTLIESEQIWREVRHRFALEHGGRWNDGAQEAMIGMRTAQWAHYMHDDLGVSMNPDDIARQVVELVVKGLNPVPVLPGAGEALERCASAFRLGVATSSATPVAHAVLERTGWKKYFHAVVSADEVTRGKPAPDVYLRALERLGATADRAAAVEDSTNGIRSAHNAKLPVVAIPNREFPPAKDALKLAARELHSLADLDPRVILSLSKDDATL